MIAEIPLGGASPRSDLPGFHVLVPVWGTAYCDLFTEISLPSQLAAGNLPSLPHKDRCLYHVLTRPEDRARIEQSQAWQRLTALMPARIEEWTQHERTPHDTMSACLRLGIAQADACDAASLFFNPDLVFADGAIAAMVRRVASGTRVVFTTGVRLLKETALDEIKRYQKNGTIALAPRDLAGIALRNLHPISRQNFWSGAGGTLLPATLFWSVGDEGFLARCFHLHPLLVWPERKNAFFAGTVDDDFVAMACPTSDNDHVVTDSDELLMCEISDAFRVSDTPYRKGSVDDVVDWAESHTDARHRRLVTFPIRFHATDATGPHWRAAEMESDGVIKEVMRRLDEGWLHVLLRSPTRLLRRWVRLAATASATQRNRADSSPKGHVADWYLAFYRGYGAFCTGYESLRKHVDAVVFGPNDRPYPWSGRWFTVRQPVAAALEAAPDRKSRTLIIAPDHDIRRALTRTFDHPVLFEWTHAEAAAKTEPWPHPNDAFDLAVCVEARVDERSELQRVMADGGQVVVVSEDGKPVEPGAFATERRFSAGGTGSTLARRLYRWSERQYRVHRPSPVVLEMPLWPFIVVLRFCAGCLVAIVAALADVLDRGGSYDVTVLRKQKQR